MKLLIVLTLLTISLLVSTVASAFSWESRFNANTTSDSVYTYTSYYSQSMESDIINSVFVKSRVCLASVCAVEEKRKVKTCDRAEPSADLLCGALANFLTPTEDCRYCGESLWRHTNNGVVHE